MFSNAWLSPPSAFPRCHPSRAGGLERKRANNYGYSYGATKSFLYRRALKNSFRALPGGSLLALTADGLRLSLQGVRSLSTHKASCAPSR